MSSDPTPTDRAAPPVSHETPGVYAGTETAMGDQQDRWAWTVQGESYHGNSSTPWKPESHDGVIQAESAGEALEHIVTGRGAGATLNNTIPWDLIDQGRPITISIRPAAEEVSDHAE